jgi:hypothetical protein
MLFFCFLTKGYLVKFYVILCAMIFVSGSHSFAADLHAKKSRTVSSTNSACEDKAKALAKAVMELDFPDSPIVDISLNEVGAKKGVHTYAVAVNSGGKMDMQYSISVEESGLHACYLQSVLQK